LGFYFIISTTSFHFSAISPMVHALTNYTNAKTETDYNVLEVTNSLAVMAKHTPLKEIKHQLTVPHFLPIDPSFSFPTC
jgi:hypothetical protein